MDWRSMQRQDLGEVMRIADIAHPDLPERPETFEKRLALYPRGSLVLADKDRLAGYAFGHPILDGKLPPLDSVPDSIPAEARQFYIHDVVVLPEMRGRGYAAAGVEMLLDVAAAYDSTVLVSVYGTPPFWSRFGFVAATPEIPGKLASYGEDAVLMVRQGKA